MSDYANTIRWEQDADGVVTLVLDDPNQSANTMNQDFGKSLAATVERLESEVEKIPGVVITSAKKTFFAGGDLNDLIKLQPEDAARFTDELNTLKGYLRRLEKLGKPVVAAINGAALGGGLEIALATHRRIVADVKGVQLGLPEVQLGLLPGGGGVTRTVRLLGIQNALMNVLLQGPRLNPSKAKDLGLVHELVGSVDELVPAAKAWIKANPEGGVQPWDQQGYKIPGGSPSTPSFAQFAPAIPANLRKQTHGAPMPAPRAIVAAAIEGAQVDFDNASLIETRYMVSLAVGQVAKNMTKAFFFDLQHINSGGSRPKDEPKHTPKKIGVLGAGMMGAGIAYVSAKAGFEVVLKDVTLEAAQKGKAYSEKIEAKALSRGKTTQEKSQALLARITPSADPADFAGVDFVIEAVFENVELKHKVFQEIQDVVEPDALLGSNTSTLPITILAEGVKRQEDFIGIHFFSPVDKMPLVEIIRGKNTSDKALAKVFDYTLAIKKTPIVVNDSRGFFTSRVIGTLTQEALLALQEGVEPVTIEQAGLQAGYPVGPLQLLDELTLTLPLKIAKETKAGVEASGGSVSQQENELIAILEELIEKHGRKGRSSGAGFYDYDAEGKRGLLWAGLREAFHSGTAEIPLKDLQERYLFAEALETVKCFDEGVLTSVPDANIGSIFGIGFPAWTGGVSQYIDGYPGGVAGFVERAKELAAAYGERFTPPASLLARV
ncbi:3-hydroxyacyl-CoA dehydrogenase NAD-binding protein [Segniliparus rotundus DSM 44985]|uniref:3-hydroxyacyl-CoA dehydrogenase NAD-binding protein n=1 Tax=Segniliparus rotundus (strain ATCC BAA-972 / CDC 1076 / CIP 108378 / DSM 44985 / JCM 13578) TaxID=640132 RepID=D6ZBM1_SEGRD|nr:3-hydroxyacyl-CoA dehydrogenase NAD-binding domain-containing protein [Segniliparus rotundus]ADG98973.1 3-hydroxyacyl-CoA dehydrogenase NAD-binding protein [Segniliparus rotundus DSM 44985]